MEDFPLILLQSMFRATHSRMTQNKNIFFHYQIVTEFCLRKGPELCESNERNIASGHEMSSPNSDCCATFVGDGFFSYRYFKIERAYRG